MSNAIRAHEKYIFVSDLVGVALRLMSERKNGFMTTKELIEELAQVFNPQRGELDILPIRSDTYFSAKVRLLVSRRHEKNSFVYNGFAEYVFDKSDPRQFRRGLRITSEGSALVKSFASPELRLQYYECLREKRAREEKK
jgi:hypothetical protein